MGPPRREEDQQAQDEILPGERQDALAPLRIHPPAPTLQEEITMPKKIIKFTIRRRSATVSINSDLPREIADQVRRFIPMFPGVAGVDPKDVKITVSDLRKFPPIPAKLARHLRELYGKKFGIAVIDFSKPPPVKPGHRMSIPQLRKKVARRLRIGDARFNGSVADYRALPIDEQIALNAEMLGCIRKNPDRFTRQQVATANAYASHEK